jgi:hypothetical protein
MNGLQQAAREGLGQGRTAQGRRGVAVARPQPLAGLAVGPVDRLEAAVDAAGLGGEYADTVRVALAHQSLRRAGAELGISHEAIRKRLVRLSLALGMGPDGLRAAIDCIRAEGLVSRAEAGETVRARDLVVAPDGAERRITTRELALARIDRELDQLADEYVKEKTDGGGRLDPEREADYERRFAELARRSAG